MEAGATQAAKEERAIGLPEIRIPPALIVEGVGSERGGWIWTSGSEEGGLQPGATGLKEEGQGLYTYV